MTMNLFFGLVGLGLLAAILVKLEALSSKLDRFAADLERQKR